ncbi:Inner membrane ALBINO3-like protein 1 [Monoraphidium neglectum]|uniref:Inner membrane ALBINO3-like protein 1 n=1 Tax=Monoraphidium neglectum TaxID=145388 RepID=A0A0D2LK21_9CHLO|nr:Inner membrane ALBINO3-like protein 1 [Monoraphidium neglectum]KIZ06714.1 Inner membrane ALBINO3-like protein 1 [Monoraphidium neglectum]|eukprot:XP_013905733.1 Inner membrane ALBINO3-like protein 1 [Monoraphidium neglectum]
MDLASAAVASAPAAGASAASSSAPDTSWFAPLTNSCEAVLKQIQGVLVKLNVPYSYGYSIILLTVFVKILTYPLTKKQVESAMAVQSLKPRIDMIKARYGDDDKRVQEETKTLYEKAEISDAGGVLRLAARGSLGPSGTRSAWRHGPESVAPRRLPRGCPRAAWRRAAPAGGAALDRSRRRAPAKHAVAQEGLLDAEGFYWIPNLAGPTSIAARGTEWLFPFVDGAPPIGWDLAGRYLVLPVLMVVAQWISSSIITPPIDPESEGANTQRALAIGLPVMVGYFSLCVPSGLSLYYFANTVFTGLMQVYLRKLGGATVKVKDLGPVTKVGSARRLGPVAADDDVWEYQPPAAPDAAAAAAAAGAADGAGAGAEGEAAAARGQVFYARRKRAAAAAAAAGGSQGSGSAPSTATA